MATKDEAPKHMRIKMITGKRIEVSPGSFVQYQAGELYLLDAKTANQWIIEGSAIDPNAEEVK